MESPDTRPLLDRRFWWLNTFGWTLLAAANSVAIAADLLRADRPAPDWRLPVYYLAVYAPWFLITPAVFWWVERVTPDHASWRRLLWRYSPLLPAWILFYLPAQAVVGSVAKTGDLSAFSQTLIGMPFNQWVIDTVYLAALVGIAAATHHVRETRRRDREAAQLAIANAGLETRLSKARLEMLRAQLEPHFLYNALNSIAALVRSGDAERAVEAVGLLSELLRYATRATDRERLQLSEEIDFAEAYWGFQQLRYGERLECCFDVDDRVQSDWLVPSLILQPLLENAVRHGVEALEAASRVSLRVRRHGPDLEILIANSPGSLNGDGTGLSVGLRNTQERLRWLYGDAASLTLQASDDGTASTVTACLILPVEPTA